MTTSRTKEAPFDPWARYPWPPLDVRPVKGGPGRAWFVHSRTTAGVWYLVEYHARQLCCSCRRGQVLLGRMLEGDAAAARERCIHIETVIAQITDEQRSSTPVLPPNRAAMCD